MASNFRLLLCVFADERGKRPRSATQTGARGSCGPSGNSTWIGAPLFNSPPHSTMPMTPGFRLRLPATSRAKVAAINPGWNLFSWRHGLRNPVTSMTAASPRNSFAPLGRLRRSTPSVVTFSPIWPAVTANPAARNSSNNSLWIRCTCRRFGELPNLRIRERCLTVAPAWASPSTPCPANNVIRSSLGLLNVCFALRLTALTTPGMYRYPCPQHAAAARRWCPESDLNQRPTAYEAVALPLSYRGVPPLPAPAYLADCQGPAKALGAFRRTWSVGEA